MGDEMTVKFHVDMPSLRLIYTLQQTRDCQHICLSLYYSHSVMQKLSYCIDKQLFVKILTNDGKNIYSYYNVFFQILSCECLIEFTPYVSI